jgi:hypothetical protein
MKTITLAMITDYDFGISFVCDSCIIVCFVIDEEDTEGCEQRLVIAKSSNNKKEILLRAWTPENMLTDPILKYRAINVKRFNKQFIKV